MDAVQVRSSQVTGAYIPYTSGRMMYMTSDSHSFGLASGLTRDVGALTEDVVKAFGSKNSSTGIADWVGGGGVKSG